MFRLALKSVRHNPKRLILTAIAVALGVALVAATHIFTDSLDRGFSRLFGEIYDGIDVIVEPVDESGEPLSSAVEGTPVQSDSVDQALLDQVASTDGVASAVGNAETTGTLLDENNEPLGGAVGFGPPTLVLNWSGNSDLDSATLVDGEAPVAADELVIDVTAAENLGLAPGDTVVVGGVSGTYPFTVTGTITFGDNNSTQGATLLFMPLEGVYEVAGEDQGFTSISVLVDDSSDPAAVAETIGAELPDGTRAITGEAKGEEQAESLGEALQAVDVFTLAFAFIAVFVGGYIIANTFRIIVTQRTRELGLLRAVGVKGTQIRSMVLLEAAVIGLVAAILGILAGYGLAGGIIGLLKALGPGESFATPTIPLDAIIWGLAVGLLVTVSSALLPAIHASSISPMEALRDAATQTRRGLRLRNAVGGLLAVVGAAAVVVGLYAGLTRPYIYVGVGAVLLVLGVTLLAAQLLVPLAYALRGTLARVWRVDGKLAANNIRREPRRSANTAAALMIGVMLLALTATVTQTVKSVAKDSIVGQITADFMIAGTSTPGTADPQVVEDFEAVPGIALANRYGEIDAAVDGKDAYVSVVDSATADQTFAYGTEPPFDQLDGGVFVAPSVIEAGTAVGDQVEFSGPDGDVTLEVTGTFPLTGQGEYFIDFEQAAQVNQDITVWQWELLAEDGADLDQVRTDLDAMVASEYPLYMVQSPDDLLALVNQVIDLMLAVITALLSGALVIAMLGVANTLLLSVTERTREIGLLRAVGARRKSVRRMIRIESVVMSLFGAVLGIILGVALGVALVRSLEEFGFDTVAIPWVQLSAYAVLAIVAGILAAWWPARRAAKLDILKAIAFDG